MFKWKSILYAISAIFVLGLFFSGSAMAAGDTTFGTIATATTPVGMLYAWMKGSMGVLVSLIAFIVAIFAATTGKLTVLVGAVGVALAMNVGPAVLNGMFAATLPVVMAALPAVM
ncbi:MAG: hypothetical protein PHQ60_02040 [Sideroxydans sp.]|nr:hypothetical protein [Sideroxydans sp.]MDD5056623.1 hypothetical protein [Sideroxydans sp.]